MTSQVTEPHNASGTTETGARSKRPLKLTPKALQNAIEDKRREILYLGRRLLNIMQSVKEISDGSEIQTVAHDLEVASEDLLLRD